MCHFDLHNKRSHISTFHILTCSFPFQSLLALRREPAAEVQEQQQQHAAFARDWAAEKKEMEEETSALKAEVARLTEEVKVAAQNARATSGQVGLLCGVVA